jgi:hypothetical protein
VKRWKGKKLFRSNSIKFFDQISRSTFRSILNRPARNFISWPKFDVSNIFFCSSKWWERQLKVSGLAG